MDGDVQQLIKLIQVVKVEPGDILVVEVTNGEEAAVQAVEAFQYALEHVGLADEVSCILHDGNVEITHVRLGDVRNRTERP